MKDFITTLANNFNSPIMAAVVIFLIYILLAKIADIFTDKIIRVSKPLIDSSVLSRGRTIHEINKAVYNRFNEAGITIPFPHRTVYVREDKNWEKK